MPSNSLDNSKQAKKQNYIESLQQAITELDNTLKKNPRDFDAWLAKGEALSALKLYQGAMKCFEKAEQINPLNEKVWIYKGNIFQLFFKDHKAATQCFDRALQTNPKNEIAWTNKGNVLTEIGRCQEAMECYKKALEHINQENPMHAGILSNIGSSLCLQGKYQEAIGFFEKSLRMNPKDDQAWNDMGLAFTQGDEYEKAIDCFEEALKINPQRDDTWSNKGYAFELLSNFGGSISDLEYSIICYSKALQINPRNAEAAANIERAKKDLWNKQFRETLGCKLKWIFSALISIIYYISKLLGIYKDTNQLSAKKLQFAFSIKEKAENLLPNLENLKRNKKIDEAQYASMKNEYIMMFNDTNAEIAQIKSEISTELESNQKNLDIYNKELKNLEIRYKVGELTSVWYWSERAEGYRKADKNIRNKIEKTQQKISELKRLLESKSSAEVGGYVDVIMEKGEMK